jgi:repressor of nif and glnA expression
MSYVLRAVMRDPVHRAIVGCLDGRESGATTREVTLCLAERGVVLGENSVRDRLRTLERLGVVRSVDLGRLLVWFLVKGRGRT